MKTIWKFPLPELTGDISIRMPVGAQVLRFEHQVGTELPSIWALVDPENDVEDRQFSLFGTGHPVPDNGLVHLGTCQHGPFVWHLFEAVKP